MQNKVRMSWLACSVVAGATAWAAESNVAQLPEVVVAKPAEPASENSPVGEYQQPEWTTHRRFPTTRVYLQQPPWEMGVEQWVRTKAYDEGRAQHRVQEEFEIGLPNRFQLDLYVNSEINGNGTWYYDNFATEIRYALADWGKIPMNPTVYGEYKIKDSGRGPDVGEVKLLLGGQWPGEWDWAFNTAFEWDLGGEQTKEYAQSFGVSHAIIDRTLSAGIEGRFTSESVDGERGNPENALNIGPSLQWRPTADTHIDIVPLFGLTDDAPDLLSYVVIGYDFGRHSPGGPRNPVSSRGE